MSGQIDFTFFCLPSRAKQKRNHPDLLRLHPAYIARPLCPDLCFNPGARKFLRPLRIAIIAALRPDKLTEFFKSAAVCHRLLRKPKPDKTCRNVADCQSCPGGQKDLCPEGCDCDRGQYPAVPHPARTVFVRFFPNNRR